MVYVLTVQLGSRYWMDETFAQQEHQVLKRRAAHQRRPRIDGTQTDRWTPSSVLRGRPPQQHGCLLKQLCGLGQFLASAPSGDCGAGDVIHELADLGRTLTPRIPKDAVPCRHKCSTLDRDVAHGRGASIAWGNLHENALDSIADAPQRDQLGVLVFERIEHRVDGLHERLRFVHDRLFPPCTGCPSRACPRVVAYS